MLLWDPESNDAALIFEFGQSVLCCDVIKFTLAKSTHNKSSSIHSEIVILTKPKGGLLHVHLDASSLHN